MIDAQTIQEVTGAKLEGAYFDQLGLVDTHQTNSLSFLDQEKFAEALIENDAITGALVTPALSMAIKSRRATLVLIEHEDPRWAYYTLHNHFAVANYSRTPSRISQHAVIHPTASIAEYNVEIGAYTEVAPFVTILPDVKIGENCIIQAGTVIGSVGFELKRTNQGILSVFHDGIVSIGNGVEIGANTCIDKGFSDKPTVIDDGARIDNLVHVAHKCRIGSGAFVIAGTVLGGESVIEENVWLSINSSVAPGVIIGEDAFVSIGSVVTRSVPQGSQVTGNFAVPHKVFLKILKQNLTAASDDRS